MPPRTKLDADPAADAAPAPDETPTPEVADAPVDDVAEEASPVEDGPAPVTHVRATAPFTFSYGQQLIAARKGDEYVADIAVYLSTAGVPVEPVQD